MRGRIIIVTGIPGVGKTAVLDELQRLAEQEGKRLTLINYASVMLDIARQEGRVLERDEMRHMSIALQKELQAKAADRIAESIGRDGTVVIDTHMIVRTGLGYWAGLPSNVLNRLRPSLLVLLEAKPREILLRRAKDRSRVRDRVLVDEIRTEIELSRSVAAACATLTGAPVRMVMNSQGRLVETAEQLLKLI